MSFRGAPLTKVLAYSCFLGPFVGSFISRGLLSTLTLSSSRHVYGPRPEIWRLFTSILTCDALIAAGVSCYLLWKLRLFERQMGSSKFAAFVVSSGLVAVAARGGLVAIPILGAAGLSSGPFHVIFGLMPLYFCAYIVDRERGLPTGLASLSPHSHSHPWQTRCPNSEPIFSASSACDFPTNHSCTFSQRLSHFQRARAPFFRLRPVCCLGSCTQRRLYPGCVFRKLYAPHAADLYSLS